MVAGGASAWNMILERDRDARMKRTANRPLPSGRVTLGGAVTFASTIGLIGLAILGFGVNWLSAGVAATTFVLYVGLYTPLKSITTLNTAVGAIPGALPPVIGWAAATGRLGIEPWALFLLVFLWQFPHFLAIAWIYRDDYARGGLKMLPSVDIDGAMTGRQAMWHALELLLAGFFPYWIGLAGPWYLTGAVAASDTSSAPSSSFRSVLARGERPDGASAPPSLVRLLAARALAAAPEPAGLSPGLPHSPYGVPSMADAATSPVGSPIDRAPRGGRRSSPRS